MGANIAESLQEINNVKLAIKESINQKGGELTDEPFSAYAAKIDSLNTSGSVVDTSKYQVIIHVTNGDGSELVGQIITVNGVESELSGMFGEVQIEGAVGDILNLSFSHRDEFYKPGNIMYTIAADIMVKVINVSYVPIASVVTYGYKITEATSDPLARVEYTDDAVGKVKGSPAWDIERIFKEIKPCLFKNGVVVGYLDPNNFEQFEDGTPADITTGLSGDVMIEFPKVAYKMSSVDGIVSASVTNNPDAKSVDSEYSFNAFSRESEGDREHCYIGAYGGQVDADGKLRSLGGGYQTTHKSLSSFRSSAQSCGAGYQQLGFYQWTLLQHLYLIRFGSTNSQIALGLGRMAVPGIFGVGDTRKKGMNFGTTSYKDNVKLFGIEAVYGGKYTFIDGCVTSDGNLLTSYKNFNDTGDGYQQNEVVVEPDAFGVLLEVQGGTHTGFIPKKVAGQYEKTKYYTDSAQLISSYPNYVFCVGSSSDMLVASKDAIGMFLYALTKPAGTGMSTGARLCYV